MDRGCCFFFQAEDGIRDGTVTGVQTCALPIACRWACPSSGRAAAIQCSWPWRRRWRPAGDRRTSVRRLGRRAAPRGPPSVDGGGAVWVTLAIASGLYFSFPVFFVALLE